MKLAALTAVALALLTGRALGQSASDILNLALQLEYLEATYYSCATTGLPLNPSLTGGGAGASITGGGSGTVVGCQKATLDPATLAIGTELLIDEQTHVSFLRGALGAAAVPQPNLDISNSFAEAASAALGKTLSPPFSPYASSINFLLGGFLFEPVGATAYLGAAPSLVSNVTVLGAAAAIYGVEAYHAGILGSLLYQNGSTPLPYGVTVAQFTQDVANLENEADNSMDAMGITALSGGQQVPNLVPVNSNAMIFARSPQQVLDIVTLGNGTVGGFFPNGLNGFFGPNGGKPTAAGR